MATDQTKINAPSESQDVKAPLSPESVNSAENTSLKEKIQGTDMITGERDSVPEIGNERESATPIESKNSMDDAIGTLTDKLRSKKKNIKPIPKIKDAITIHIEQIMEDGLSDAYQELTPVQRQEFKIKGEQTALQIRELIKRGKTKIRAIFKLLIDWLVMLPGVNRFFAEQEAKIKADRIIELTQK